MTDTFEAVIDEYTGQWLDALDALLEPFPFAAACLACVTLDHLGNAIGAGTAKKRGKHKAAYLGFIREFLCQEYQGADAFPNDDDMCERLYTALRCGLVHEARTDDHGSQPTNASRVRVSHEDFAPFIEGPDMILSIPWLVRCVRRAWDRLRQTANGVTRERVAARLQLAVDKVTLPRVAPRAPSWIATPTLSSLSASGFGSHFASRSESLENLAYEQELRKRRHTITDD